MSTRPREYCAHVARLALENVRPEADGLVAFGYFKEGFQAVGERPVRAKDPEVPLHSGFANIAFRQHRVRHRAEIAKPSLA
jgi:hypothetical protein